MIHILALLTLGGLVMTATAADWPCWRGPAGGGSQPADPGPLVEDVNAIRQVWKSEYIEGTFTGGYSSPVVSAGRVFVYFYYGDGKAGPEEIANYGGTGPGGPGKDSWKNLPQPEEMQKRRASPAADEVVVCLDATSGKTIWRFVSPSTGLNHERENTAMHGTACVRAGKVVVQGVTGWIFCLDEKTGAKLWAVEHPVYQRLRDLRDRAVRDHKQTNESGGPFPWSAPVISTGKVIFGVRGEKRDKAYIGNCWEAYDLATGTKAWTLSGQGGGGQASPLVWTTGGQELVLGEAACLDPTDGTVRWTFPKGEWLHRNGTPALEGDLLVLGGGGSKSTAGPSGWRLSAAGPKRLWQRAPVETIKSCGTSPGLHRGVAYLHCADATGQNQGYVLAIDAATGTELGRHDGIISVKCTPSVVAMGDRVIFPHVGGAIDIFTAGAGFRRLGTLKNGSAFAKGVTPALVGGLMFTRGTDGVYCFDLRKR